MTALVVFAMLIVLESTAEISLSSGWWWIVAAGPLCGVLISLSRSVFRQIGVALTVAS
ncbi:hypothetical protein [Nocardia sp. NPDC024068]|uniref:hypothetical protein n=1 Tax=Nocardia sp. NPDC024068 TaxID=3157197 RepID=UPI0033CC1F95